MGVALRSPQSRRSGFKPAKEKAVEYTPGSSLIPPYPETLGKEGQKRWIMLCSTLISKGLLSPDFFHALEHLCRAYDFLEEINKSIERKGLVITGHLGEKPNPLIKDKVNVSILIRASLADFGLTPSSSRNGNVPIANLNNTKKAVTSRKTEVDDDPF